MIQCILPRHHTINPIVHILPIGTTIRTVKVLELNAEIVTRSPQLLKKHQPKVQTPITQYSSRRIRNYLFRLVRDVVRRRPGRIITGALEIMQKLPSKSRLVKSAAADDTDCLP